MELRGIISGLCVVIIGVALVLGFADLGAGPRSADGFQGPRTRPVRVGERSFQPIPRGRAGVDLGGDSPGGIRAVEAAAEGRPDAHAATDSVARLRGRIVDTEGRPVPGGMVSVHCADDGAVMPGGRVKVDARGHFEAPTCSAGVCVRLSHTSMIQVEPWEVSAGDRNLLARPLARLVGKVVDGQGVAIVGAKLTIRDTESDIALAPAFVDRSTISDAEGEFAFARVEMPVCDRCAALDGSCEVGESRPADLVDGPMEIIASHPDHALLQASFEASRSHPLHLVMPRGLKPLRGRLIGSDEQPFARARIALQSELRRFERRTARVDAQGRFEFRGLGTGPYQLIATQDGIELARKPGVGAGDAEVELQGHVGGRGRDLELVFRTPAGADISGMVLQGGPFERIRVGESGTVAAPGMVPGRYVLYLSWADGRRERQDFELSPGDPRQRVELVVGATAR